jgi:putative addiction module killer protein
MEMRVDYGPGYRIYYTQRGSQVVLLLCGGQQDIERARRLSQETL